MWLSQKYALKNDASTKYLAFICTLCTAHEHETKTFTRLYKYRVKVLVSEENAY